MSRGEYEIRSYEPGDREAVLGLYAETFGDRSREWFDWRYVDNPFLDEVPIVVAEWNGEPVAGRSGEDAAGRSGEVIAARPSLPIPLDVGGERVLALMQVDPMVHPDHRRQGLFTRMVTHVHERYASREPSVSIGFPGSSVRGTLEKLADELALDAGVNARFPEYARVQAPGAVANAVTDGGAYRALGQLATPAVKGYLSVRDRLSAGNDELQVERVDGAPPDTLSALAAEGRPDAAHAHRCERFYRWRFANPRVDYTTYLAHGEWGLVAALVLGRRVGEDTLTATVADVIPLDDGDEWAEAVSRLLGTALDDAGDADVVTASGTVIPRSILETWGFRSDDAFPFSLVASPTYLLARPLVEHDVDEWILNGMDLARLEGWALSGCERELG